MKRALVIGSISAVAVAIAVAVTMLPPPSPKGTTYEVPKHVVVISIDTLRADHLGTYGHPRARTPFLDTFADEGVVFEQNISVAPTTLASHTSLFTGNAPHTHGAAKNDFIVNDDNLMLQEVLGEAGFETAAFIGAVPIASHSHFTQGFEHIDETFSLHRQGDGVAQTMRSGAEVTAAVLAWLDSRQADRPLFLFAHYFDVHSPYRPPEPWRSWYNPDASLPNAGSMRHIDETRRKIRRGEPDAQQHSDALKELYLGGVSYTDHQVGRLLKGLQDAGVLDEAIVIITSDHGETFDTHSEQWDHGYTVYDETVHTPLMVRLPGAWRAGSRIPDQVSSLDLFPSLVEMLGLTTPPVEGVSWADGLLGQPMPPRGPAFSEATKPGSASGKVWKNDPMQKSARADGYKFILTPRKKKEELYGLVDDPGELNNLLPSDALEPQRAELARALDAWRAEADPLSSDQLSSERVRMELAALGYVDALPEDQRPKDSDEDEKPTP